MMNCPKCQKPQEDSAKFCASCGGKMTVGLGERASHVAKDQAKKIGSQAGQVAQSEFQNGVNSALTRFIRDFMAKIFGR